MKTGFLLCLLLLYTGANGQSIPKIDSIIGNWNKPDTPGGVVAVIHHGNIILKQGYGLASLENKVPNTSATLFNVASLAKQFTAMCIALLEEQKKLSFDDDIRKYFPQFKLRQTVTLRHLLTHTSGLREAYVLAALAGKTNLKGEVSKNFQTTEKLVKLMSEQKDLNFTPGSEFAYTNINYILLGEVVRKVSGLSLREFANQHIFRPLQMNHTFFDDGTSLPNAQMAGAYQPKTKNPHKFTKKRLAASDRIVGDHNLVTSLDDLIRWDQNFYQNQLGNKDSLLLQKMQTRFVLNNGDTTHYGFGLNVTPYKNYLSVGHGGDDYHYTSFAVRFPGQRLSIICLSNLPIFEDTQNRAFAIADILLKIPAGKDPSVKNEYLFTAVDTDFFRDKLGNYIGTDKKNGYYFRQITLKDTIPYLSFRPDKATYTLLPVNGNHFVFKVEEPDKYVEAWFIRQEANGEVKWYEKFRNDTIIFSKKPSAILSKTELRQFAGRYTNEEIHSQMKVKVKKKHLVFSKGIIKIKTISVGDNTFYAADHYALFRFEKDGQGKVKSFMIDAVDFRNVKFEKSAKDISKN